MPAHLTLLYPFVEPAALDAAVRGRLARVALGHPAFDYVLAGQARWPDTVYARVEPVHPFVALQHDLERSFPDYPIYGGATGFMYVPHVTIAEGPSVDDDSVAHDRGWQALPLERRVTAIEVISRPDAGPWRTVWRMPLGGAGSVGRMRP